MNPQFKKYYDQIMGEEEKARESIQSALEEKYIFTNFIIIYFLESKMRYKESFRLKKN